MSKPLVVSYGGSLDLAVLRFYNEKRQQEWDNGEVLTLEYLGNGLAGETGLAKRHAGIKPKKKKMGYRKFDGTPVPARYE